MQPRNRGSRRRSGATGAARALVTYALCCGKSDGWRDPSGAGGAEVERAFGNSSKCLSSLLAIAPCYCYSTLVVSSSADSDATGRFLECSCDRPGVCNSLPPSPVSCLSVVWPVQTLAFMEYSHSAINRKQATRIVLGSISESYIRMVDSSDGLSRICRREKGGFTV